MKWYEDPERFWRYMCVGCFVIALALMALEEVSGSGDRHAVPFFVEDDVLVVQDQLVRYEDVYEVVNSYGMPFKVIDNIIVVDPSVESVDIYFGFENLPRGSLVTGNSFIYRPDTEE